MLVMKIIASPYFLLVFQDENANSNAMESCTTDPVETKKRRVGFVMKPVTKLCDHHSIQISNANESTRCSLFLILLSPFRSGLGIEESSSMRIESALTQLPTKSFAISPLFKPNPNWTLTTRSVVITCHNPIDNLMKIGA